MEVKSEFGFDTEAAESRFVAKRMSELLTSILSYEELDMRFNRNPQNSSLVLVKGVGYI